MDTFGVNQDNSSTTIPLVILENSDSYETIASTILGDPSFYVRFVLNPLVFIFSFASGVVNIMAFSRMELSQGVNQSLLALSCSDIAINIVLLSTYPLNVLMLLGYTHLGWLGPRRLYYILVTLVNSPVYVSLVVTTLIAVVRCASIVFPLTFRRVFTPTCQILSRTLLASTVGLCMFLYTIFGPFVLDMYPKIYYVTNGTKTVVENRHAMSAIFDIFRNTVFYTCFGINTFSTIFLVIALKKAVRFQHQSANISTNQSATQVSATRDARVVKTVILILAIFLACNFPINFLSFLRLVVPTIANDPVYALWYRLLITLVGTTMSLNTGLNCFVYYRCNTQYRENVRAMFRLKNTLGFRKE